MVFLSQVASFLSNVSWKVYIGYRGMVRGMILVHPWSNMLIFIIGILLHTPRALLL